MTEKNLIVITGPTASGKSALAIDLAEKLQTSVISADSRQIYKGVPIATAVPDKEELKDVPHHLLEILPLEAYYSASKFVEDSSEILKDIFAKHDYSIVCGGSMMYIDALIYGIDDLPTVPPELRYTLMNEWHENGDLWLLDKLKSLDKIYYEKIDHRNLKRVFHAIEISLTAGKPYSSLLTGRSFEQKNPYNITKVCLDGNRDHLFERINNRVIKMMEKGLEEEARSVYHLRHLNSLNTVGLKEMFAYFDGSLKKTEAVARIQKNTRVYAKKQLTWHRRDNNIFNLNFSDSNRTNMERILDRCR